MCRSLLSLGSVNGLFSGAEGGALLTAARWLCHHTAVCSAPITIEDRDSVTLWREVPGWPPHHFRKPHQPRRSRKTLLAFSLGQGGSCQAVSVEASRPPRGRRFPGFGIIWKLQRAKAQGFINHTSFCAPSAIPGSLSDSSRPLLTAWKVEIFPIDL